MPYEIVKRGDQHCVVKQNGGATVKCHASREKATAHLRALYANVKDAGMADGNKGNVVNLGDFSARRDLKLAQQRRDAELQLSRGGS